MHLKHERLWCIILWKVTLLLRIIKKIFQLMQTKCCFKLCLYVLIHIFFSFRGYESIILWAFKAYTDFSVVSLKKKKTQRKKKIKLNF